MLNPGKRAEQVRLFVASFLSEKPERLLPTTRLGQDLGVDGDDGVELMHAFSERFGVDMSGFECDRHFGPEDGCSPVGYALLWLFERERLRFVPVTLADLAEAADTGVWRTPNRAAV